MNPLVIKQQGVVQVGAGSCSGDPSEGMQNMRRVQSSGCAILEERT